MWLQGRFPVKHMAMQERTGVHSIGSLHPSWGSSLQIQNCLPTITDQWCIVERPFPGSPAAANLQLHVSEIFVRRRRRRRPSPFSSLSLSASISSRSHEMPNLKSSNINRVPPWKEISYIVLFFSTNHIKMYHLS